jgi:nicotinamidase-related amidase
LVTLKNVSSEAENEVTIHRLDTIAVWGLAGDYCVKETLKNLYEKCPNYLFVLEEGIASIDGGKALKEYVEEKHIMKSKLW